MKNLVSGCCYLMGGLFVLHAIVLAQNGENELLWAILLLVTGSIVEKHADV